MKTAIQESTNLLSSFMRTTERAIVSKFAKLPGAIKLNCPMMLPAVYVPGTRKDRVLLVAHFDTVWGDSKIQLELWGTHLVSANDKVGIGADDRAGIAALWALRDCGHSLLLVPEEECGCLGADALMELHKDRFDKERFAIQFDRRGSRDIVMYGCANNKFDRFMKTNMCGYHIAQGSISDISVLCPALGIAGANLSIGFEHEHSISEQLDVLDWYRTVESVRELLSKECPRYVYKSRWPVQSYYGAGKYGTVGRIYDAYGNATNNVATGHMEDLEVYDNFDAWNQYQNSMSGADACAEPAEMFYWCDDCAVMYDDDEMTDHTCCISCGGPLTYEEYEMVDGNKLIS